MSELSSTIDRTDFHPRILFVISLVVFIANGYLFMFIRERYFPELSGDAFKETDSKYYIFILACVVGPFVETFLFQVVPNRFLMWIGVQNEMLLVIVPSILFGLFHTYDVLYVVSAALGGVILNYLYLSYKKRIRYAFYYVFLLHSLYNLYGFLFIE
jgi:hypothetical protein